MKVLQINAVYGLSSTGRTTKELDEGLRSRQIESYAAVTVTNTQRENIRIIGNRMDWKLHAFFSRLTGKQGYFSHYYTKKLIQFMRQNKPDIVHLRNLHSNYIHLPMLLAFLAKEDIATVVTLHDCWFYTGKCTHYIAEGCCKWQTGCQDCPKLQADNPSWFLDKTSVVWQDKQRLFAAIPRLAVVGVSDWVTDEARRSFLKDAAIVKRIYNWIDIDVFTPREVDDWRKERGMEGRFIVLGVAQSWLPNKGLTIFTELAKQMPEVLFIMVGNMPLQEELPDNIRAVGTTDSVQELAWYYAATDVLLNPSRYETFGKTTAEALACGTPVIGCDATATPELIGEDGGVLVRPDADIATWKAAVETVRRNGKAYYTASCRKRAEILFQKENLIEEYITLYNTLLS